MQSHEQLPLSKSTAWQAGFPLLSPLLSPLFPLAQLVCLSFCRFRADGRIRPFHDPNGMFGSRLAAFLVTFTPWYAHLYIMGCIVIITEL